MSQNKHLCNDPSAGSPTETLLRLLLPLNVPVRTPSHHSRKTNYDYYVTPVQGTHWYIQSVVATGGVYKGQGLISDGLRTQRYKGIPCLWDTLPSPRPKRAKDDDEIDKIPRRIRGGFSKGYPLLSEKENERRMNVSQEPIVPSIVARVQPRASKGITDLLLLFLSERLYMLSRQSL